MGGWAGWVVSTRAQKALVHVHELHTPIGAALNEGVGVCTRKRKHHSSVRQEIADGELPLIIHLRVLLQNLQIGVTWNMAIDLIEPAHVM